MLVRHIILGSVALFVCASQLQGQAKKIDNISDVWSVSHSLSPLIPPRLTKNEKLQAQFGKKLFFDKGFSLNGKVACASCHIPEQYFTDGRPTAKALAIGKRNTPTVVNSFALTWGFWDGRVDSTASQALKPIEDRNEHGTSRLQVYHRLRNKYHRQYKRLFGILKPLDTPHRNGLPQPAPLELSQQLQRVERYGTKNQTASSLASKPIVAEARLQQWARQFESMSKKDQKAVNDAFANFGLAIAQFERTIVAVDSPFDRFVARWQSAEQKPPLNQEFGASELRGLRIFAGKGLCMNCHHGPSFSDHQFHNVGFVNDNNDLGRAKGVLAVKSDPFACEKIIYRSVSWIHGLESCREKPFLDLNSSSLIGAFKTPTLRNVEKTAPYGHHGRLPTLAAVIEHYSSLPDHSNIGHREEMLKPLHLSAGEKQDLEHFLKSLSSHITIEL